MTCSRTPESRCACFGRSWSIRRSCGRVRTRGDLTAEAAEQFASLAERLRGRGHEAHAVAHFLNKLLFCMFAEDAGLLPRGLVRRLAGVAQYDETIFTEGLGDLFAKTAMACGAEYVVTGNRAHFPEAFCRGATVISPAGFVAAYRERPA